MEALYRHIIVDGACVKMSNSLSTIVLLVDIAQQRKSRESGLTRKPPFVIHR